MKRRRKLLSVLLSAALVITMIPAFGITASAEDDVIRTKDGDEIPMLFARYPDGIHPASDTTGDALQYYADVLAPLVATVR